jgi:hypothetical protein
VRARRAAALLLVAAAGALSACSAHTVPPSDVAFTSATLRASGDCASGELCIYYFEWGPAGGASLPNHTPLRYLTGPTSAVFGERVTGLPAGALVDYRLCGSSNLSDFQCVGEDGTSASRQRFRVASPPSARYSAPALAAPTTIRPSCGGDGLAYPHDGSSDGLSPGKDYVVDLGRRRLACSLWIVGGRNVVVRNGEIWIPGRGDSRSASADAATHYGLYLKDQTGEAFATRLLIDGEDMVIPIALNERLGATVTIERVRAANMRSHYAGETTLAAAHGDCLQSYAGPNVLRVDLYTCLTDYFGLQLSPWEYVRTEATWPDSMTFNNVNFRHGYAPNRIRYQLWRGRGSRSQAWPMTFSGVYLERNEDGARGRCATQYDDPGNPRVDADHRGGWRLKNDDCSDWPAFAAAPAPITGDFVDQAVP